MVDLLLIYPYYNDNNSIFKFPPLGVGYIASYVKKHGYSVSIIDCTFMREQDAVSKARSMKPRVIGIYSMLSMKDTAIRLAKALKGQAELTIAGGPLPTSLPESFLDDFDIVVLREGEETVLEILAALDRGRGIFEVEGIAYRNPDGSTVKTPTRELNPSLDSLPFPEREMYDHERYKSYYRRHHGYTITSIMTSRGCPFDCDFCSRPVFGNVFRSRSAANVVDEMEIIKEFGYDRIWIADDIFPLTKKIGLEICDEITKRKLDISWECLCRSDLLDLEIASKMKASGCHRVFFGLESGNNEVLRLMRKRITTNQAREAVETVNSVGIRAGAFFILGYPGESNDTMLDTMRFASSLPLDYLSFTVPYPLPGTALFERLKDRILVDEWKKPRSAFVDHVLLYRSEFSMGKLRFGIIMATSQHLLRKHLGPGYPLVGKPIDVITGRVFTALR
ncbi:MAG: radical SAM protein [Conexivisphaerales archaeon]|jgi:anaerobic magnesium-protoporphyrin IX monomethyl ester cyclase